MTTPRKKTRILVKLVGVESNAEFVYEYDNDADAIQALKAGNPILAVKAHLTARALNFPFSIRGVPIQQTGGKK